MINPLFSIVIPTYNHEKFIIFAIQSVIDQTFENWELIIVDMGLPIIQKKLFRTIYPIHELNMFIKKIRKSAPKSWSNGIKRKMVFS